MDELNVKLAKRKQFSSDDYADDKKTHDDGENNDTSRHPSVFYNARRDSYEKIDRESDFTPWMNST
jgi:hypothetical protein